MEAVKLIEYGQSPTLRPITIIERWEDNGPWEDRVPGFLTGPNHAMFVDEEYGCLMFAVVEPTDDPSVYLGTSFEELGRVIDNSNHDEIVEAVTKKLYNMNGFDFLINLIKPGKNVINFEDRLVPACYVYRVPEKRTQEYPQKPGINVEDTIKDLLGDISELPEEVQQQWHSFVERVRARHAAEQEGTAV